MELGDNGVYVYELIREDYGGNYDTIDYIEEIAAKRLQTLFKNPQELLEWRAKLETNPQAKRLLAEAYIGAMEKAEERASETSLSEAKILEMSSKISMTYKKGKSYSLKDSEGNTLTEAQQEYFKDSKVRDENVVNGVRV